jgi:hypothetical protein
MNEHSYFYIVTYKAVEYTSKDGSTFDVKANWLLASSIKGVRAIKKKVKGLTAFHVEKRINLGQVCSGGLMKH